LLSAAILAQTPDIGIRPNMAMGEVSSINTAGNEIVLKTKDGAITAQISSTTVFKRVPPENPTLSAAVASSLGEIGVGDKVLVSGTVSQDKATIPAKQVILMTKSDISKRDAKEKMEWRTRGISGRVVTVDIPKLEVVVATRTGMTETNVKLTADEKTSYIRYSPESIKYGDAKESSFAEIKVGDQLRAVGEKSTDGLAIKAEKVLTGAFKVVAGTITAIDAQNNKVTIKEFATNKAITIAVKQDALLRKFPAEMASAMAMGGMRPGGMQPGGGQGGANVVVMRPPGGQPGSGAPQGGQTPPTGGQPGGGQPGAGQPGGMRPRGELDDLLTNLPAIKLDELKAGEVIAISCSSSAPDKATAFKVVSGVEPFITAAQAAAAMSGGGRGGQAPSLNIPGLDGFGTP
jgi:hypothetical protein